MNRKSGFWLIALALILLSGALFWRFGAPPPVANGEEPPSNEITLLAAGDLVVHLPVIQAAYDPAVKAYDFRPSFAGLREEISRADLATAVLEIPLSGPERKYSGYPTFNSPFSLADALQWAGFDLAFTASNHSLDQGFTGLQTTQAYLKKIGLAYTGSRSGPEEPRYRIIEAKGFKVAFIAFTTITNGLTLPPGQEWALNRLDPKSLAPLAAVIKEVRAAGVDVVILALHHGAEYKRQPAAADQQFFRNAIALGVDVLLGSHVHVIQPRETVTVTGADGKPRSGYIIYSLGNFYSNQYWRYSDCGLVVSLKIRKEPGTGTIAVFESGWFPIWVDRFDRLGKPHYRVIRLSGPEQITPDPDLSPDDRIRMRQVWQDTETLLGGWEMNPARVKP